MADTTNDDISGPQNYYAVLRLNSRGNLRLKYTTKKPSPKKQPLPNKARTDPYASELYMLENVPFEQKKR